MTDPVTDLEAAKAFTKEHGFTANRYSRGVAPTITFGPDDSPTRGKPRCFHRGFANYDTSQCTHVGKVTLADGSTWCGTHAPAAVARRKAAKDAKAKARMDRWEAGQRLAERSALIKAAGKAAIEALRQIADGHNDPRALAAEVLAMLPETEQT